MRVQVNIITRRRKGGVSRKSQEFEVQLLTIGRGTDQEIFLPDLQVAYHHAEISFGADNQHYIQAKALSGIRINGVSCAKAKLKPGSRVMVGSYEFLVQEPAEGFDLVLDVEQIHTEEAKDAALLVDAKTDLAHTSLRKRRWSWVFFISVFLLFFVLPLLSSWIKPVRDMLNAVPILPSDSVWSSGDLTSAHHFFKEDCTGCHQTPFIRVRNTACAECHKKTHQHADPKFAVIKELNESRCYSCHEEHNGSEHIIVRNDALCSDCHADLEELVENDTKILNASDFGDDHPEFRPSIPVFKNEVESTIRVSLSDAENLQEQNTLFFTHKAHLDPEGVENTDGEKVKLDCDSCHLPDSGGLRMQAITFERHCSDCHRLDFETTDKDRVVPHGDVGEVVYSLEEYYKSRALEGGVPDEKAPAVVRTRRRPGTRLTTQERLLAMQWATKKAQDVAMEVFKFRTCKTCHTVAFSSNASPPWTIARVRIPDHWMPYAKFTHAKHTTMACEDCHTVKGSEEGSDVLLPNIESCRECHGGADDRSRLASTCVDCHGFHIGEGLLAESPKASVPISAVISSDGNVP